MVNTVMENGSGDETLALSPLSAPSNSTHSLLLTRAMKLLFLFRQFFDQSALDCREMPASAVAKIKLLEPHELFLARGPFLIFPLPLKAQASSFQFFSRSLLEQLPLAKRHSCRIFVPFHSISIEEN